MLFGNTNFQDFGRHLLKDVDFYRGSQFDIPDLFSLFFETFIWNSYRVTIRKIWGDAYDAKFIGVARCVETGS